VRCPLREPETVSMESERLLEINAGDRSQDSTPSRIDACPGNIESKVVVFVNLMFLHAEAFSSTSDSELSRTCASLREWADEWDNHHADSGNWYSLLDDWCGMLSSKDDESSKQSEANGYTSQRWKHLEKLHQIWQAEGFSQSISTILHLLSPGLSLKFLKSLCVRVPHDEIPVRLYQFADIACPVSVVSGRLDQGFKVKGGARQRILDELKGVAEEHPSRPAWWQITRNAHRSRVVCFYTTVQGVFGQKALDLDGVKISQAIIATSDIIDVHFATPFGQALVSCNWALAFPHFVWNRSADLLFQFLLVYYLSPDSRSRQEECEKLNNDHWNSGHSGQLLHPWVLTAPTAITILGLRTGVCMFIELVTVMAPVIWRCGDPLLRPRLFFIKAETLFCYVVELWSLWFAVCLWTVDDYICTRPFHLSMLIFVKWFQFMLSCLNFSFLIEHLLPAWVAMTSRQSILFLAYLVLTAAGTSMAYYALPIEEASEDNGPVWEWISAFVLTFRLDFLADFDDKDLEGVHQMVNSTNHQIEDVANPQAASFHWVLKVFTLACGLFFPVIALNLYVGLLGVVYEDALKHDCHLKGTFQMNSSSRLLVQRHFWRKVCCGIFDRCGGIFSLTYFERFSRACIERGGEEHEGFWIVVPEESLDEMYQEGEEDLPAAHAGEPPSRYSRITASSAWLRRISSRASWEAREASIETRQAAESMQEMRGLLEKVSTRLEELRSDVKELRGAIDEASSQPKKASALCFRGGAVSA